MGRGGGGRGPAFAPVRMSCGSMEAGPVSSPQPRPAEHRQRRPRQHGDGLPPGLFQDSCHRPAALCITILGLECSARLGANKWQGEVRLRGGVGMSALSLTLGNKRKAESLMTPFQIPRLHVTLSSSFCYCPNYLVCILSPLRSEYPRCSQIRNTKLSRQRYAQKPCKMTI